jgi:hypothetical protein
VRVALGPQCNECSTAATGYQPVCMLAHGMRAASMHLQLQGPCHPRVPPLCAQTSAHWYSLPAFATMR